MARVYLQQTESFVLSVCFVEPAHLVVKLHVAFDGEQLVPLAFAVEQRARRNQRALVDHVVQPGVDREHAVAVQLLYY